MFWGVAVFYGAGLVGLAGRVMLPDLADGEQALMAMALQLVHPVLAGLTAAQQQAQICGGAAELARIVDHPVAGFAYPYGSANDFDATSTAILRQHGVEFACTTESAPVRPKSSPLQLPRLSVGDWSGDDFALRLLAFLDQD